MKTRELTSMGYPGYVMHENGKLYNSKGRQIHGNANGQVRMQAGEGFGSTWVLLDWLIATVLIPNPSGFKFVRHMDGSRHNYDVSNLEWWPSRVKLNYKAMEIIRMLNGDMDSAKIAHILGTSLGYIEKVKAQRLQQLLEEEV